MVSAFMISRSRSAAWLGLFTVCSIPMLACQRVPLLAPSGSTITLTTSTTALPVNGTTQVLAQVLEQAGVPPHSGTHVTFTTTLGTMQPSEVETDANGQAISTFNAGGASGTATINAISGGANVGTAGALKILVGTAAVGRVIVNASPSLVPALGGASTVTAVVIDVNGNALVSAPVSFSTSAGVLSVTAATTDKGGNAQTVLTTSTAATVTASVGATATTPPPAAGGGTTTPTAPTTGQASGTVTVGVAGAPTLVITQPTTAPTAGLPASFTFAVTAAATNGTPIRDVTVDWGDGQNQDLGAITGNAVVVHTYRSAGSFTINATVTDGFGNRVPVSTAVIVNPTALTLTITPPTTSPSAGLPAFFTIGVGTVPAGDVVRNIHLDWGDGSAQDLGSISANTTVSHVFKTPNTYTVSGTLTDTAGNSVSNSTSVTVIPVPRPTIIITPSPVPGKVNTQTTLTIQVTLANGISVQDLTLAFGDGQQADLGGATSAAVPHVYTTQGTFTVTATVLDTSGQTTIGTTVVSIGP
jgi:hypothetical protein